MFLNDELFNRIKDAEYIHTGLSADYCIQLHKNELYFMFEESDDSFDWVMNFLFIPVWMALPVIWILSIFNKRLKGFTRYWNMHLGIALVWNSIESEVFKAFENIYEENKDLKVISCGWSHGGGIAQACAIRLHEKYGVTPTLYTYGSLMVMWSRIGQLRLEECIKSTSLQFANGSDIVPRVPPAIFGFQTVNRCNIGEKFCIFKIFKKNPPYHLDYGNPSLY